MDDTARHCALTSTPARELARLVRGRQVSPVEIVRAHLDRIQAVDGQLHAFQAVLADQALSEASALADRDDLRRGRRVARKVEPASADSFVNAAAAWFADFDAFLTPTLARPPVPVGTWSKGWVRTMLGVGNWIFTTLWNLAGFPAASVPFGSDGGVPIGLQLVAPAGGERTVLSLASQLEQLRP